MKKLVVILFVLVAGCGFQKPKLGDVSNLVDQACRLAQLAPDMEHCGKSAEYWCNLAGVALDVAEVVEDVADNED
jgi:hypothetical protein